MARRVAHPRAWVLVPMLFLGASSILSACGAGPSATSKATVIKHACTKVSAALSDGPDPSADPVGYAEAQIRPLSQIKTSDTDLQTAIRYLDATYRLFYQTNGAHAASNAVKAARQLVSVYCPGIGS